MVATNLFGLRSRDDQRRIRGTRRENRFYSASSAVSALNVCRVAASVYFGHAPSCCRQGIKTRRVICPLLSQSVLLVWGSAILPSRELRDGEVTCVPIGGCAGY